MPALATIAAQDDIDKKPAFAKKAGFDTRIR
jgi:hypothetical protein